MKDVKTLDGKGLYASGSTSERRFRMSGTLSSAVVSMYETLAEWMENHMDAEVELGMLADRIWKHCRILVWLVKCMSEIDLKGADGKERARSLNLISTSTHSWFCLVLQLSLFVFSG